MAASLGWLTSRAPNNQWSRSWFITLDGLTILKNKEWYCGIEDA